MYAGASSSELAESRDSHPITARVWNAIQRGGGLGNEDRCILESGLHSLVLLLLLLLLL